MSRTIAANEADVVQWLLNHANLVDVGPYRTRPVQDLRIVKGCECGCASLNFQTDRAGSKIIADALALYPDGQLAGLILWGRNEEIVHLEIFDYHPEASRRFPELSNLQTWEERGISTCH